MVVKCEQCGHLENNGPLGTLVEWLILMGFVHGGPIWSMNTCPKCKGIIRSAAKEHVEQDKSSVRGKQSR